MCASTVGPPPSEGGGWQGLFGHCPIAVFHTSSSSAHLVGVGEGTVLATAVLALLPSVYREALPLYATMSKRLFGILESLDGFGPLPHLWKVQNSLLPYVPTRS